jgi:hypothetical protein
MKCPVCEGGRDYENIAPHFLASHGMRYYEWIDEQFGDEIEELYLDGLGVYSIPDKIDPEFCLSKDAVEFVVNQRDVVRSHEQAMSSSFHPFNRDEISKRHRESMQTEEYREKMRSITEEIKHRVDYTWSDEKKELFSRMFRGQKTPWTTGENHYAWKPGASTNDALPYGDNWQWQKKKVRHRDEQQCVVCGDDDLIHVHHIIPRSFVFHHPFLSLEQDGNSMDNLVTLCAGHHRKAETGYLEISIEPPGSDKSMITIS